MHVHENVDYELIWDIVETLVEVAYAALRMLLEDLEFRVLLVQLVSDGAADDVRKHGLQGLLVAVVVGDGQCKAAVGALFVALDVRLLTHHAD